MPECRCWKNMVDCWSKFWYCTGLWPNIVQELTHVLALPYGGLFSIFRGKINIRQSSKLLIFPGICCQQVRSGVGVKSHLSWDLPWPTFPAQVQNDLNTNMNSHDPPPVRTETEARCTSELFAHYSTNGLANFYPSLEKLVPSMQAHDYGSIDLRQPCARFESGMDLVMYDVY